MSKLRFILLFLIVAAQSTFATTRSERLCRLVLTNGGYPRISQYDVRLQEAGLFFSKDESRLCGPTCGAKAIYKILNELNLPPVDPGDEVIKILDVKVKSPSGEMIDLKKGTNLPQLKKLIERRLSKLGVDAVIEEPNPEDVDWREASSERTVIIVGYQVYRTSDLTTEPLAKRTIGGHWVIVLGEVSKNLIAVDDPIAGFRILNLAGPVRFASGKANGLWLRQQNESLTAISSVLEDVLVIRY